MRALLFLLSPDVPVHDFNLIIDGGKRIEQRSEELMHKTGVKKRFKKERNAKKGLKKDQKEIKKGIKKGLKK